MAQYTVEDIEILRQKSGISYEEAVNLLEYHNGSLAKALVDLEKNGRLKDAKNGQQTGYRKGRVASLFNTLYRMRVKVNKGNVPIINVSVLFVIFMALTAFWVLIIGGVAAIVLGYRFAFERNSADFSSDNLKNIVKNASSNVKNTAFTFAKDMGFVDTQKSATQTEDPPRAETAASGTTPVNVQFPGEGKVDVKEDQDGFHEADIQ